LVRSCPRILSRIDHLSFPLHTVEGICLNPFSVFVFSGFFGFWRAAPSVEKFFRGFSFFPRRKYFLFSDPLFLTTLQPLLAFDFLASSCRCDLLLTRSCFFPPFRYPQEVSRQTTSPRLPLIIVWKFSF